MDEITKAVRWMVDLLNSKKHKFIAPRATKKERIGKGKKKTFIVRRYDWNDELERICGELDVTIWMIQSIFAFAFIRGRYSDVDHPSKLKSNFERILRDAAIEIGLPMLARVLAFTYVVGSEWCIYHPSLRFYIPLAQLVFNIRGGHHPRGLEVIRQVIYEFERDKTAMYWYDDFCKKIGLNKEAQPPNAVIFDYDVKDLREKFSPLSIANESLIVKPQLIVHP